MPSTNIIPPLTSFIGRTQELAEVKALLQRTRLLTLTGVGGCGKTRLAMQLAAGFLTSESYPDGIWWIDFVGLNDPMLVPQVVGQALNLRESANTISWKETLKNYLATRHILLILDNCEHLLTVCSQLVKDLLSGCPNLQILATSRQPLDIPSEISWLVPSMPLPEVISFSSEQNSIQSHLVQYDAVNLFVERAASILPTFTLTDENSAAVVLICRQIDGLPLAIELAAARVNVLGVQQIADRLNDRFALLTGGNRTALIPRHQTLQATMDWSYDLLSKQEQTLFQRLSVFAGGFELETVEAICSGDEVEVKDVLDLLSHLIDKSLVLVNAREGNVARYRLLETIRQYASERLSANHETENLRQRHSFFFLELAEKAKPELMGPNQKIWFERLDKEKDNSRIAFNWLLENDIYAAARLASDLFWFWNTYCYWSEARDRYAQLLKFINDSQDQKISTTDIKARLLCEAGWLALDDNDPYQARLLSEEGLTLYRELGDKKGIAMALNTLGWAAYYLNEYSLARTLTQESLTFYQEIGFKWKFEAEFNLLGHIARAQGDYDQASEFHKGGLRWARETGDQATIAYSLVISGYVAWLRGDLVQAEILSEEGRQISCEVPLDWGIAVALNTLGDIARAKNNYLQASQYFEEDFAILERLGHQRDMGNLLYSRGWLACAQQHYVQAAEFFRDGLMLWREVGDKRHIAECLEGLAGAATYLGKAESAAKLMGVAEILREETNSPLPPVYRANYDRDVATIRSQLGEANFFKAWAEGREFTFDQMIDETFQIISIQKSSTPLILQSANSLERLNERELEVLRLIAQGFSNREIADKLVLAVSTVKWYINNIFAKLQVRNRTQAVIRARELTLL
jgi:predicted ATPase/DNA-binding CsgD family transcriptional regulator